MIGWNDTESSFGKVSIFLHWISAGLVIALLVLGGQAYFLERGPERSSILYLHVSLGLTLIPIHVLRIGWRARNGKPHTAHDSPVLATLAGIVWRLLIVLVAVQVITGPILVWLHDRPVEWFGMFGIAPPFHWDESLHERVFGPIHLGAGVLLVLTIGLHLLGALKHLLIDRDNVMGRMIGVADSVPAHEGRQEAS